MKIVDLGYMGEEIVVKIVCEVCGSIFASIGPNPIVMCYNCGEIEYIGDVEQEVQNLMEQGEI
jgi:hypothetical protein